MAIQPTPKASVRGRVETPSCPLGPKQPSYPPPPHRLNRHAYTSPQGKAPCTSSLEYVAWLKKRTKSTAKKTSVAPEHAENSGVGVKDAVACLHPYTLRSYAVLQQYYEERMDTPGIDAVDSQLAKLQEHGHSERMDKCSDESHMGTLQ